MEFGAQVLLDVGPGVRTYAQTEQYDRYLVVCLFRVLQHSNMPDKTEQEMAVEFGVRCWLWLRGFVHEAPSAGNVSHVHV